jgi:hypothetical protein
MAETPPTSILEATRAADTLTDASPTSFSPTFSGRNTSFTSEAFLETVAAANRELYEAVLSREATEDDLNPDEHALPNALCVGMLALGDMLDELLRLGISPAQ